MTIILHERFEGGPWTHDVRVFPVSAEPYTTLIGSIFTPRDWLFWFKHQPDIWDQPEARQCWRVNDPNRVKEGNGAWMFFSFWRHHDAGLMRRVSVEPGTKLRLTAWAHAWSNASLPGHEDCCDDGRCSCGVGRQVVAIAAEDIPDLNDDPWNDALGNSVFVVGIDPNGGEDPFSLDVEWGPAFAIYNGYAEQLEVEAVAGVGGEVTVFLRNTTLFGFKHNDAYWDQVTLETITALPPPPPPYQSTMLVLPQDATPEQLQEIFTLAYPGRRTFGFSHDDAGNLHGTSVCYNISGADKQAYLDFYATRYPDVKVEFAYTSDWEEPPGGLLLWQCDPRWKDEKIAGPGCSETLCQLGCWISDCAMAQRYFGIKLDATPSTANQALGDALGFSGCMTLWTPMKEALGLEVVKRSYDEHEVREWLDTGNVVFGEVEPEGYLHFVLITRYKEGRFWMHDPWKNIEDWVDEHYPGIESWRLIRPFDTTPPPPPPVTGSLVSLHLQTLVDGALDFVGRVKPSVVKVFQLEVAKEIKARSPDTLVVLRYFTGDQNLDGNIRAAMRAYVQSFQPSLEVNYKWIDKVESFNEMVCSNNADSIKRAVEADYWFAEELMALGFPGIAPQLLNVAVGNPLESEVELLLPAVEQVVKYGGTLGYHAYGLALNGGNLNDAWQYYAGRALEGWDPVFRAHGLYPLYIFGECGAFSTCNDGWRSGSCLNGNWPLYLAQLTEMSNKWKVWNTQHGNRCLGGTLFTTGGWDWDTFEITKTEMEDPNWPL